MTFNAQFYPFLSLVDRGGFIIFPTGRVLLQRFPGGCNKWGEEEYKPYTHQKLCIPCQMWSPNLTVAMEKCSRRSVL